jgi:LacI family transcriptional regulator
VKRVSLADVARATGLGRATVSRALSGHEEVGAATRARVLDVAKDMGYQPNGTARALRTGRHQVLALTLATHGPDTGSGHAAQVLALALVAADLGYRLLVDVVDLAGTSAATALGHLDGLGVDGALVLVPQASPGLADDVVLAHEVVAGADVDAAVAGLRVLVMRVEARIEG